MLLHAMLLTAMPSGASHCRDSAIYCRYIKSAMIRVAIAAELLRCYCTPRRFAMLITLLATALPPYVMLRYYYATLRHCERRTDTTRIYLLPP